MILSVARRTLLVGLLLVTAGCYEIEPELEINFIGSPAQPGWPPPAVYHTDPFHPLNRLFQRLFILPVEKPGTPGTGRSGGDPPFSSRKPLGAVDRAEVLALLEVLEGSENGLGSVSDPTVRAVIQSDLLFFLGRNLAEGEANREVREALARAVESLSDFSGATVQKELSELPPPMTEGGWKEVREEPAPGFRPAPTDLRWTRVFRRGDSESLLLRLRMGQNSDGEPVRLQLGSEAWYLATPSAGEETVARVYQLRRSRILLGESPWEEIIGDTRIEILDPEKPGHPLLSGSLPGLCTGCH